MPYDKSHPVTLNVGETRNGDVAIKIGGIIFEVEAETAEQFAETILTVLGRMRGISYWVMKAGQLRPLTSPHNKEQSDDAMHGDAAGRTKPDRPGAHIRRRREDGPGDPRAG